MTNQAVGLVGYWDLVIGAFLLPHFRERNLRSLEDDLRPAKAEALVEAASAGVVGRDFQIHPVDARPLEARERMPEEHSAQAQAAMTGRDAHILNRADARVGDALNGAA